MKAITVEDEHLAAQALTELLREVAPDIEVVTVLQSIDESVEWFHLHPMPDLVFMDIHLADGSSFSIFDEVNITCPVIFTTAYDEYALKAFEVNSVGYLLKPIGKKELERAVAKAKRFTPETDLTGQTNLLTRLMVSMQQKPATYKSSFLISVKDKLIPIQVRDIAYIYIDTKIIKVVTYTEKSYALDMTMDEIMQQLNPTQFFRANRQYIIARQAVKDMTLWFGNKLAVSLTIATPERIYISRTNVKEFKSWFTSEHQNL